MKARQLETKLSITLEIVCRVLRQLTCFAAVTLICSSAPAQNLFMSATQSDNNGNFIGAIYEFDSNGVQSTFASGLNFPGTVAFDSTGNLFVTVTDDPSGIGSSSILKFTPAGVRSTFAVGVNGPLAVDRAGNVYAADSDRTRILKFTPEGVRTTFASGVSGQIMAIDGAGNLFVENPGGALNSTLKFTPDGNRSVFVFDRRLGSPNSLAFDSRGNLFVATGGGVVNANGIGSGAIHKIAPNGTDSVFASGLHGPVALVFDSADNLFVADTVGDYCSGTFDYDTGECVSKKGTRATEKFFPGAIYKFTPDGTRTTFLPEISNPFAIAPTLAPRPAGPRSFANLSTRLRTELGNDVAIGGFIITGHTPKTVIVRACGPSIAIAGNLADPNLELHDGTGQMIAANDNWIANRDNIMWSGLAPNNDHEAAIVTTLSPGSYTAVVRGVSSTSGVALVEIYDLSGVTDSKLANISTRGKVETGDDLMIGGFVIGGDQPTRVLVRVIGPSLTSAGIQDALADSVLQLFNGSGTLTFENDDWRSAQKDQIETSGLAPADDRESAIVATLPPGSYTAVVRGKNDTTGVALVEIYNLETN